MRRSPSSYPSRERWGPPSPLLLGRLEPNRALLGPTARRRIRCPDDDLHGGVVHDDLYLATMLVGSLDTYHVGTPVAEPGRPELGPVAQDHDDVEHLPVLQSVLRLGDFLLEALLEPLSGVNNPGPQGRWLVHSYSFGSTFSDVTPSARLARSRTWRNVDRTAPSLASRGAKLLCAGLGHGSGILVVTRDEAGAPAINRIRDLLELLVDV